MSEVTFSNIFLQQLESQLCGQHDQTKLYISEKGVPMSTIISSCSEGILGKRLAFQGPWLMGNWRVDQFILVIISWSPPPLPPPLRWCDGSHAEPWPFYLGSPLPSALEDFHLACFGPFLGESLLPGSWTGKWQVVSCFSFNSLNCFCFITMETILLWRCMMLQKELEAVSHSK